MPLGVTGEWHWLYPSVLKSATTKTQHIHSLPWTQENRSPYGGSKRPLSCPLAQTGLWATLWSRNVSLRSSHPSLASPTQRAAPVSPSQDPGLLTAAGLKLPAGLAAPGAEPTPGPRPEAGRSGWQSLVQRPEWSPGQANQWESSAFSYNLGKDILFAGVASTKDSKSGITSDPVTSWEEPTQEGGQH